jgi:hypothetical protein
MKTRDKKYADVPFGGKIMVFGGDFIRDNVDLVASTGFRLVEAHFSSFTQIEQLLALSTTGLSVIVTIVNTVA